MKSFALHLTLALCIVVPSIGQNQQERSIIHSVTEEYLTAWYEGNEQLMASVVHPQMSKKIVFDTGHKQGALAYLSAQDLLAQTRKKRVQSIDYKKIKANITILDVYHNSAMVKAETQNWIDYLHMAKISGEWKIVNILWELKYEGL